MTLGRVGGGGRLDRQAEFITVQQVGDVFQLAEAQRIAQPQTAHETARALPRMDQPPLAQAAQRLADDGARDLEFGGEFVFGRQAFAIGIGARFDGLLHPVEDDIGKAAAGGQIVTMIMSLYLYACRPAANCPHRQSRPIWPRW